MVKSINVRNHKLQFKKTKILDRIAIFTIRTASNYFWIIIDILSHQNSRIAQRYERSIGKEYKNECEAFQIAKGKKILHVGCGSYPLTEMTIARLFDISIVGIDKSSKAIQRANEVIRKNHLEDNTIIFLNDKIITYGSDFLIDN